MQKIPSSESPLVEKIELVLAIFPIPLLILIAIFIPKYIYNSEKAEASEVLPMVINWSKLQKDYYLETEEVGNAEQIGFEEISGNFIYETYIEEETIAFILAKNKNNIGGCPEGSEWQVIAEVDDDGLNFDIYLPENENCKKLTPDFEERITEAVTAKEDL